MEQPKKMRVSTKDQRLQKKFNLTALDKMHWEEGPETSLKKLKCLSCIQLRILQTTDCVASWSVKAGAKSAVSSKWKNTMV